MSEAPVLALIRGTLDLLILKTLSWGPLYGLGIVRWIANVTQQRLQVEEGALYPALNRMEQKGWLESEWGITEKNRKVKFYQLTRSGRSRLAGELAMWTQYTEAVGLVLVAEDIR